MAEVLAFVASVVAVVEVADHIVDICKFYIESVNDSPSDLRLILLEISALKTVLENVKFLASCPTEKSTILSTLAGQQSPIEGCRRSICDLERLFPSDISKDFNQDATKKHKLKALLAALAWPLKEKKARKLLDEILRYKSTITVALTTENTRDIKEIKSQTSDIHKKLTEHERQEVLKWLQHTDPFPFHHQARKNFEPGTGDWILRMPEWNDWLETNQRCIWLHGIPGAGKTVLISSLVEETRKYCQQQPNRKLACVYYYCYFGHDRDETIPFLHWLLGQLCRQSDLITGEVYQMYRAGGQPPIGELIVAVAKVLKHFETLYVIVDAVDESNPREVLLLVLKALVAANATPSLEKIQLLVSSREYIDIERTMRPISIDLPMANPFVEEDIRRHIHSVLRFNPKFSRWSPTLLAEVEDAVSRGAQGMFRWAVCQIDALKRLRGDMAIVRQALANLPKDLDETYDRVLLLVPEEEESFVQHALQWIRFHGEVHNGESFPCTLLLQAIAKSTSDMGLSLDTRFYDIEILQEVCGCLVKIHSEGDTSGSTDIRSPAHLRASFAHFTVQEYLDSVRTSKSSSGFSVACKLNLWQNFTTLVFREAFDVKMKAFWETQIAEDLVEDLVEDITQALRNDFDIFSLISAFLSLRMDRTIENKAFHELAYDLLNPHKQHYKAMKCILFTLHNSVDYFNSTSLNPSALCEITWDNTTNADAIFLCNLVQAVTSRKDQESQLKWFLKRGDAQAVLQARVRLKRVRSKWELHATHIFDGPLVHLLISSPEIAESTLILLFDYARTFTNPSTLLFAYLVRHDHDGRAAPCDDNCFMTHLLNAGADPDGPGYTVTPLQIAISTCDLDAVWLLLEAGANPNHTGKEARPPFNRFDSIQGQNPLRLCARLEDTYGNPEYSEVRRLLHKHGAKDVFELEPTLEKLYIIEDT